MLCQLSHTPIVGLDGWTRTSDPLTPNQVFYQAELRPGKRVAEEVGFEPTVPFSTTVFKTAAFSHSATPPNSVRLCSTRPLSHLGNIPITRLIPHKGPGQTTWVFGCGAQESNLLSPVYETGMVIRSTRPHV
jgi:hypothetical protein